jgi:hypothetical protein
MTLIDIVVVLVVVGLILWADQHLHSDGGWDQKLAQRRRIRSGVDLGITSVWPDWSYQRSPYS